MTHLCAKLLSCPRPTLQINLEFEEGATGKWRELPTQGFLEFRSFLVFCHFFYVVISFLFSLSSPVFFIRFFFRGLEPYPRTVNAPVFANPYFLRGSSRRRASSNSGHFDSKLLSFLFAAALQLLFVTDFQFWISRAFFAHFFTRAILGESNLIPGQHTHRFSTTLSF